MRWVQHWQTGKDCLKNRKSLMYQFGCILPDWFEHRYIHRWQESRIMILERIKKINEMPNGWKRDWYLGTIAHYVCDYCCMAHNDQFYNIKRHRIYEVESQKYYKKHRLSEKTRWLSAKHLPINSDMDIEEIITRSINALHKEIEELNSNEWHRDFRIMELDIEYSYALLQKVVDILELNISHAS